MRERERAKDQLTKVAKKGIVDAFVELQSKCYPSQDSVDQDLCFSFSFHLNSIWMNFYLIMITNTNVKTQLIFMFARINKTSNLSLNWMCHFVSVYNLASYSLMYLVGESSTVRSIAKWNQRMCGWLGECIAYCTTHQSIFDLFSLKSLWFDLCASLSDGLRWWLEFFFLLSSLKSNSFGSRSSNVKVSKRKFNGKKKKDSLKQLRFE